MLPSFDILIELALLFVGFFVCIWDFCGLEKGKASLDHWKSKKVPENHLLLFYWLCQILWLCGSQQTVDNSSRDSSWDICMQVRWSGIPISFRIFQFIVIHTVKGLGIVNKAEVDFLWNSLAFLIIQRMLAISSLIPLPFLNPLEHLEVRGSPTVEASHTVGEFGTLLC